MKKGGAWEDFLEEAALRKLGRFWQTKQLGKVVLFFEDFHRSNLTANQRAKSQHPHKLNRQAQVSEAEWLVQVCAYHIQITSAAAELRTKALVLYWGKSSWWRKWQELGTFWEVMRTQLVGRMTCGIPSQKVVQRPPWKRTHWLDDEAETQETLHNGSPGLRWSGREC